jgi:hypothetical protein
MAILGTRRIAMKTSRMMLLLVLVSCAASAFGQPETQKAFEKLKSLAGSWEGTMTTHPKIDGADGIATKVTFRVTSMGHTLMHEMTGAGRPDDPITMLYLDDGELALTHYCDAGNRPRMAGKVSPDGKTVTFDFTALTGGTEYGHMHGAVFTFIDADRHSEDWTFMMPDGKPLHARVELQRTK